MDSLASEILLKLLLSLKKLDKHEALTLLGKIEGVRRNYQKAADYLTRAVSKGADPSVMVDLATVLVDNGKDREALSVLSRYFSLKSPILPIPGFLQDSG